MQTWCHPMSNPWVGLLTLNNETSLSSQRQHQWWFCWHMERSHSCEPCSHKLCNWFELNILSNQYFRRGDAAIYALVVSKNLNVVWCEARMHLFVRITKINRINRMKSPRNNAKQSVTHTPWRSITPFSRCVTALADAFNGSSESLWLCGSV